MNQLRLETCLSPIKIQILESRLLRSCQARRLGKSATRCYRTAKLLEYNPEQNPLSKARQSITLALSDPLYTDLLLMPSAFPLPLCPQTLSATPSKMSLKSSPSSLSLDNNQGCSTSRGGQSSTISHSIPLAASMRFRSRRIRNKEDIQRPWIDEKQDPRERLAWILPCCGSDSRNYFERPFN